MSEKFIFTRVEEGTSRISFTFFFNRPTDVNGTRMRRYCATTTIATMAEEADTNDKATMESIAQNILEVRVSCDQDSA